MLQRLGHGLGDLLYLLLPRRRREARINIALAFPKRTAQQQERLLRAHFRAFGSTILESSLAWWGDDQRLLPFAQFHGLEHLEAARAKGRGVILVSGHFAAFEIGGRLLNAHQPLTFMYKRQRRNPLFEAMVSRRREHYYRGAIPHDDLRAFMRALRRGEVCWMLPDQDFGQRASVFAPFMGIPAMTVITPARLAAATGAAVVPYVPRRLPQGRGYDIRILPELKQFPTGHDVRDATRINALLQSWARAMPAQYLWLHRRFKTRPAGQPSLYPERRRRR